MIHNREEERGREDEVERDQGTKMKNGIHSRTQALSHPNSPQSSLPHIQEEITGPSNYLLEVTSLSDISHLNLVEHNLKRGRSHVA